MEIDVVDGGYDKVLNIKLALSVGCRETSTYKGVNTSSNAQDLAGRNRQWGRQVR